MKRIFNLLGILFLLSGCVSATSIETIIEKSEPKVVKIGIVTKEGRGVCSGAFISPEGLVLTCAHCFAHANIQKVFIKTSEGKVYLAEPLVLDGEDDIALIAPLTDEKFPYFQFGPEPKKGQQVISMGSPLGIQGTAGVGYIENIGKHKMLHSAPISPGNSGGPLLNLRGQIVGINEGYFQEGNSLFIAINAQIFKGSLRRE